MAKILKFKRGNTSKNNSYIGSDGEITINTTKKTVVVHDGITSGGSTLATEQSASNPSNIVQDSTHRFVTDSDKTNWNGKINATEKAIANGVATLDSNGKVVLSQIPDSAFGQLEYQGVYDFSTGMPTATRKGQYWIASVSGNGYTIGDWAAWNGSAFDKIDNTDAVSSVAGRTGNVILTKSDVGLNNVDNTADNTKNVLSSTKLTTVRSLAISGDITWTVNFDGSANVIAAGTLETVADSGTGTFKKITVDTKGRVTGTQSVVQTDITGLLGSGSITNTMLYNSAVANLSGTNTGDETISTIKTKLGITTLSGSNTGDQTITLTGDVTGSGIGSFAATLANSGVTAGTYKLVTVDAKGRVTSGTNPTTLVGYGITDAATVTALNTEKARIDAILSASTADKDSFAEIVTLINSVDTTNDNALAGYVTSNNAAVALKAPLASPAFTGTPTAPTPTALDNSTKVATTAYVDGKMVRGTAITASGTSIDFTGIPSWVKRVTIMFNEVSTNGSSPICIRLGDSGGIESTGYVGLAGCGTSAGYLYNSTTEFPLTSGSTYNATYNINGNVEISNINSNSWTLSGNIVTAVFYAMSLAGSKTLSGTLDRVRITTVNGTDSFDAGTINILYEG